MADHDVKDLALPLSVELVLVHVSEALLDSLWERLRRLQIHSKRRLVGLLDVEELNHMGYRFTLRLLHDNYVLLPMAVKESNEFDNILSLSSF